MSHAVLNITFNTYRLHLKSFSLFRTLLVNAGAILNFKL